MRDWTSQRKSKSVDLENNEANDGDHNSNVNLVIIKAVRLKNNNEQYNNINHNNKNESNKNNGNSENGRISKNNNSNRKNEVLQTEWHGVKKNKTEK